MPTVKSLSRLVASLFAIILGLASPTQADVIKRLTINNVAFEGGGTATGYVEFNFTTESVRAFDITTTTRIAGSYPFGFHYASLLMNAVATYTPVPPTTNLCTHFPAYNQLKIVSLPVPTYALDLRFMPPSWGATSNPTLFTRNQIATCAIFGSGEDGYSITNFIVSGNAISSDIPPVIPPIPEPASVIMLGMGLLTVGLLRRKQRAERST